MPMIITIYSSIINVSFYEDFLYLNVFVQPLITIIFNSIYGERDCIRKQKIKDL